MISLCLVSDYRKKKGDFMIAKIFKRVTSQLLLVFLTGTALFLINGTFTEVKSQGTQDEENKKVMESYPFPPGENAKLVKQVCTRCHSAYNVMKREWDKKEAKEIYKRMIGDSNTEEAEKVIEYLSTVLGPK